LQDRPRGIPASAALSSRSRITHPVLAVTS
jgi:hypothetical protein